VRGACEKAVTGRLAAGAPGWFTCAVNGQTPLVATFLSATPRRSERRASQGRRRSSGSLRVIENSLSARRIERRSPWLAGFHRISSGALAGLGLATVSLSALTLHWQNEWARSYSQLEASKSLEHRLQESAALLEQHHLGAVRRPGQLVPTSSEKLIHLPQPVVQRRSATQALLAQLQLRRIPAGY
jgi:hypothetical protein